MIIRSVARTRARVRRGLINRDFAFLWTGQVVTDLGTVLFNTALIVWVAAVVLRERGSGNPWPGATHLPGVGCCVPPG